MVHSPAVENQLLRGHVPAAAKTAQFVGNLDATKKLNLAIGLPLRNRPQLAELLRQLYDPASPNFRHYLTPAEFTERFGPTAEDYASVIEFASTNGLTITATHPNRMLVDVSGSVGRVESALQVNLRVYQHPLEARTFFAPDADPAILRSAPILHISGLDNYLIPHPAIVRPSSPRPESGPRPQAGSGPAGAFRGNDFRGAYLRGVSLNGSGQMAGLLEFDGYYAADIATYRSQASLPNVPVVNVTMDGFDGTPGGNNIEAALDIEMLTSIAPGLSQIIVYEAGPQGIGDDILNRMATDNLAKQLSASWTFGIDATTEQIFQQFAAQGQSYFNSSGDTGAYTGTVDTPADNPNVTVVGGTVLTTTGPGGAWSSEVAWNSAIVGGSPGASGGGTSTVYSIPSWQLPVNMTTNHGSTTMRNLPDVAAVADNVWVNYNNGSSEAVGGTSCSSPLWAGFTALVNQQAGAFGRPPVGFLNPAIYALGLSAGYSTNFHDIISGSNTNSSSTNLFFAVPGFDLCTGWGSFLGQNLINALAPRFPGPLITNAGVAIVSEGCSPANGAVDPGETVTLNLSLKNLGGLKTTNLVAALRADQGVLWPSGPQTYGALTSGGASVARLFSFTANGACGANLAATLDLQDGQTSLGSLAFNITLGKPVIALTQNFDSVKLPSLPSGWTTSASNGVTAWVVSAAAHDSNPNAAFADEPPVAGVEELFSPPISILSSAAQLSFRSSYNTEKDPTVSTQAFDGGLLEIQIGTNAFTDILDAGGSFAAGGYDQTIASGTTNTDNPLAGRRVWGGNSGGFISTVINLPASAAGQTIQLRWRFGVDTGNFYGGFGWYIDSVSVTDGASCCNSSADLAVDQTASPEPVAPGQGLTYSVTVTNFGPGSAYQVTVTNLLPATVVFSSGSPGCIFTNGSVLCDAGTLALEAVTNFTFVVAPTALSAITNAVVVGSATADPNLTNNSSIGVSTVSSTSPPVISLQPTNAVVSRGGVALLQIAAFGTPPLIYQWLFNGRPIAGETAGSLSITNAQPEQSGGYSVLVTNLSGSTTSTVAVLTVVESPAIQLTGLGAAGTNLTVSLTSVAGLNYTLEFKNSLTDPDWTPIGPSTPGTGGPLSLHDTNAVPAPARFYRIRAQ